MNEEQARELVEKLIQDLDSKIKLNQVKPELQKCYTENRENLKKCKSELIKLLKELTNPTEGIEFMGSIVNAMLGETKKGMLLILSAAVMCGDESVLRELIDKRTVNIKDKDGLTLLNYVVTCNVNAEAVIEILAKKGIDFNVQNEQGFTALDQVLSLDRKELVHVFLQHSAKTNIYSSVTNYIADWWKAAPSEIIEQTINLDLENVNTPDKSSQKTPLHITFERRNIKVANALLNAGAEVDDGCVQFIRQDASFVSRLSNTSQEKFIKKIQLKDPNCLDIIKKATQREHSSIAKKLFFDILERDSDSIRSTLNNTNSDYSDVHHTIFQAGWMKLLLINNNMAKELAKNVQNKNNNEVIKVIQERQAFALGVVGIVIGIFGIFTAPLFVVGLVTLCYALFHGLKPIIEINEVDITPLQEQEVSIS